MGGDIRCRGWCRAGCWARGCWGERTWRHAGLVAWHRGYGVIGPRLEALGARVAEIVGIAPIASVTMIAVVPVVPVVSVVSEIASISWIALIPEIAVFAIVAVIVMPFLAGREDDGRRWCRGGRLAIDRRRGWQATVG